MTFVLAGSLSLRALWQQNTFARRPPACPPAFPVGRGRVQAKTGERLCSALVYLAGRGAWLVCLGADVGLDFCFHSVFWGKGEQKQGLVFYPNQLLFQLLPPVLLLAAKASRRSWRNSRKSLSPRGICPKGHEVTVPNLFMMVPCDWPWVCAWRHWIVVIALGGSEIPKFGV